MTSLFIHSTLEEMSYRDGKNRNEFYNGALTADQCYKPMLNITTDFERKKKIASSYKGAPLPPSGVF